MRVKLCKAFKIGARAQIIRTLPKRFSKRANVCLKRVDAEWVSMRRRYKRKDKHVCHCFERYVLKIKIAAVEQGHFNGTR